MIKKIAAISVCYILILNPFANAMAKNIYGLWHGKYDCMQGKTALDLIISPTYGKAVNVIFYFHATQGNPMVPPGCFEMSGSYNKIKHSISLVPFHWLLKPKNFVWVSLAGTTDKNNNNMSGKIKGPECSYFKLFHINIIDQNKIKIPATCKINYNNNIS